MKRLVLGWLLAACATLPTGPATDPLLVESGRVYGFTEARTMQLVRGVLEARGLTLLPTADPHILLTSAEQTEVVHETIMGGPGRARPIGEDAVVTQQRQWMVIFEPRGPHATRVRIARGTSVTMGNSAERGMVLQSSYANAGLDPRLAPTFVRDPEQEAAVAAELDHEAAVEVNEAEQTPSNQVAVLDDPLPPTAPPTRGSCELSEGDLAPMLGPGHVLLLSDPLGAPQPWAVLTQVVCLAQARGLPVTVALSIPSEQQFAVNRWLASSGTAEDRRILLGTSFWRRDWQDGRSSEAVLETLERLRARRAEGAALTILAVDTNAPGNARSAHIASKLLRHRVAHPERFVVAMLGNVLTSRRLGSEWNPDLQPVGARVAAVLPDQTHSLDVAFWPGAHWTCHLREQGRLLCGTWVIRPGPAQVSRAVTPRAYVRSYPQTNRDGFDGVYFVGGALTPSLPAVEAVRRDEGPRTLEHPTGPAEPPRPEPEMPFW